MSTNFDKQRRVFKKHTYRGIELEDLQNMTILKFSELLPSKHRRHIQRGLAPREVSLIKKCILSKQACVNPEDKPKIVKTHARSMIILPCMVGNLIGVYNGKVFAPIEVKPEMISYRFSDFVSTKSAGGHGKPGVGATSSSKFTPLK